MDAARAENVTRMQENRLTWQSGNLGSGRWRGRWRVKWIVEVRMGVEREVERYMERDVERGGRFK